MTKLHSQRNWAVHIMMGILHVKIGWKAMMSMRVTMMLNFLSTWLILYLDTDENGDDEEHPQSSIVHPQGDQSGEATSCRLCSAQMSNQSKRQNKTDKRTVCDGFEAE